jgi:signal transduction histidine kinase
VRTALVRITREAVSNAARHGASSNVHLTLERGCLEIVDDGNGFDDGGAGGGFGLVSMRDRAEAIGGDLQLSSTSTGTSIKVVWDGETQ